MGCFRSNGRGVAIIGRQRVRHDHIGAWYAAVVHGYGGLASFLLLIINGFAEFAVVPGSRAMTTSAPDSQVDAGDSDFKPLSAEEALQWRARHPSFPVWLVLGGQMAVGLAVAVAAWMLTGNGQAGWSAAYGALAVVLPAAVFARGVFRRRSAMGNPRATMLGFFGWEIAKILLTVAMLLAAPRIVAGLSWLALLAGMVLTMKTYWIALMARSRSVKPIDKEAS
jgi:ATP synthase protein I